jgi:hypothetical protein
MSRQKCRTVPQQDAQKVLLARPQRVQARGVPSGYVEGLNDARTMLEDFFSILLQIAAVTVPNLSRHIVQLRQMQYRLGYFLS